MKKSLVFALTFAVAGMVMAQDSSTDETMENADMSDGVTHWHGDCQAAGDDMTTDFTHKGTVQGITVNLRSHNWTEVTQRIHNYKGHWQAGVTLTITYQTSPDFKLSGDIQVGDSDDERIPGLKQLMKSHTGGLIAYVDVPPDNRTTVSQAGTTTLYTIMLDAISSATINPKADGQPQTFTAPLHLPPTTQDSEPFFTLAIPPGSGSITITKISIAAKS